MSVQEAARQYCDKVAPSISWSYSHRRCVERDFQAGAAWQREQHENEILEATVNSDGSTTVKRLSCSKCEAMARFAREVLAPVFEGQGWDGGDLQDLAVSLGLLEVVEVKEPCGEACVCEEVNGDFPATCYRFSDVIKVEGASA